MTVGGNFGGALLRRANALAETRRRSVSRRLAEHLSGIVRGARVEIDDEGVRVTGKGLRRRLVDDIRLRWPGQFLT